MEHRIMKPIEPANQECSVCGHPVYIKERHTRSHDGIGICLSEPKEHCSNPLVYDDGAWFFYDETWCDRHGPFTTHAEATAELTRYCHFLNYGPSEVTDATT